MSIAVVGLRPAAAGVDVHVGISVPPPPEIVFPGPPHVEVVPRTRVYYVPGYQYDVFRYGPYWYVDRDGYWYRARDYNGPFVSIGFESVPRPIVVLPGRYHHHPVHPRAVRHARGHEWHEDHHEHHGGHGHHDHHDHHHD